MAISINNPSSRESFATRRDCAWPRLVWFRLLVLGIMLLQLACSAPTPETVLDLEVRKGPDLASRIWPLPPEVPRYRYAGELLGEQNIRPLEPGESRGGNLFTRTLTDFWYWLTGLGAVKSDPVVLQRPQSGATDIQGRIYVTDVSRRAVFVFDVVAGVLRLWEFADPQRRFVSPVGVAHDEAGNLLVTDAELAEVFRFNAGGQFKGSFGQGILRRPTGIAFDPFQKRVYVADTEANDVKIFDSQGDLLDTLGFSGEEEGRLNRPVYLAFANGHLYVSDSLNARVQVFDREGNAKKTIGRRGLYIGNLTRPKGVAVDSEGHVYVVEGFYDHLLVFNPEGGLLMGIGGTGNQPGQFYLPAGAWSDNSNRIFVADMFNGRVSIFQFLGNEQ